MGRSAAQRLLDNLSYSETLALAGVLTALQGASDGVIVGAKICAAAGVARNHVTHALRLAGAAGVLEYYSLGRNGTRVVVLNRPALEAALGMEPAGASLGPGDG